MVLPVEFRWWEWSAIVCEIETDPSICVLISELYLTLAVISHDVQVLLENTVGRSHQTHTAVLLAIITWGWGKISLRPDLNCSMSPRHHGWLRHGVEQASKYTDLVSDSGHVPENVLPPLPRQVFGREPSVCRPLSPWNWPRTCEVRSWMGFSMNSKESKLPISQRWKDGLTVHEWLWHSLPWLRDNVSSCSLGKGKFYFPRCIGFLNFPKADSNNMFKLFETGDEIKAVSWHECTSII